MPKLNSVIIGKVKDKASIGKARLVHSFSSQAVRYIHLALLKSTSHTSHKPPDSNYVSAVVSYSNSHHGPAAFAAVLWRLRVTKNAFVATKSLIVFHKLLKSSRDNKYALYLDRLSWISKVLGSFPSLKESSKEKAEEKVRVLSYQTGYIMRQTESLVLFFELICARPEIPPLYQNKIVDEIRELLIQDYFTVMRFVMVRLQVLSERLIKPGFEPDGDFDLSLVLVRLEECKEKLSGFSWCCKRLEEDFWCSVEKLKAETVKEDNEMVEYAGSVWTMDKDDKEMVESGGSVQNEWVTFEDSEMATEEVVKWNLEWVTFDDDSKGLKNEPVRFSLYT